MARQRFLRGEGIQVTYDVPTLAKRIANLIRVWNVQIIEVLGASGFKDIKKTVGEENRLLIFDDLEERIYDIFKNQSRLDRNSQTNNARMQREGDGYGWRYSQLKNLIQPAQLPHRFYNCDLKSSCYRIFDRDYVWPASLIASVGRMASGDEKTLLAIRRNEATWEMASISFRFAPENPGRSEENLDGVSPVSKSHQLRLKAPHRSRNVGHPLSGDMLPRPATRASQWMDTGEGGYPTFSSLMLSELPI
jgi:hypothetical protein